MSTIKNMLSIIKYAMDMEKKGQDFYLSFKENVKNERIRDLFESLASMEEEHFRFLSNQFRSLSEEESWKTVDLEKAINDTSIDFEEGEQIRHTTDQRLSAINLDRDLSDLPVLRMAYLMEQDYANYYERAAGKFDDPHVVNFLRAMADWERDHMEQLLALHQELAEDYGGGIDLFMFENQGGGGPLL